MKIWLLVLSVCLLSCRFFKHKELPKNDVPVDDFYTDAGDWDDYRIPLLKPYQLIRLKQNKDWDMRLFTPYIAVGVNNVEGIGVVDSTIFIHSGQTNLRGSVVVNEAWFIISPKQKTEVGFAKKAEYKKALLKMGLDSVALQNPDSVYSVFLKQRPLKW